MNNLFNSIIGTTYRFKNETEKNSAKLLVDVAMQIPNRVSICINSPDVQKDIYFEHGYIGWKDLQKKGVIQLMVYECGEWVKNSVKMF